MPLYDYQCDNCNTIIEDVRRPFDGPPVFCPRCESKMRRQPCAPALRTDTRFLAGTPAELQRGAGKFSEQLNCRVDSMGDVRRECERRGWGCSELGIKPRFPEPKPYRVSDKIVNREVNKIAALDPGAVSTPEKRAELWHETSERLSGTMKEQLI